MSNVDNTQDIIYSLDVVARIEKLEESESLDEEETQELTNLKSLVEEASDSPDWEYGESLIRDSYFQEYAQDLAEDIGAIDPNAGWPMNCIDWQRAARELRMDYTSVEFDGVTYWIHS